MIFKKRVPRINKKGFTLIELIVVIAILAILAVTAVMAIGGVTDQARLATLKSDCNTAVRSLNLYNSLVASGGTLKAAVKAGDTIGDNEVGYIAGNKRSITDLKLVVASGALISMDLSLNLPAEQWDRIAVTRAQKNDPMITYENNAWVVKTN